MKIQVIGGAWARWFGDGSYAIADRLVTWVEEQGEDGPYTARLGVYGIQIMTQAGAEYWIIGTPERFSSVAAAENYLLELPEDFTPETHEHCYWERNHYGSRAYQQEGDEALQIERERSAR